MHCSILDYNAAKFIGEPVTKDDIGNQMVGSSNFHQEKPREYKDDLESLYYLMLIFIRIRLPWQGRNEQVAASYKINKPAMRVCKF